MFKWATIMDSTSLSLDLDCSRALEVYNVVKWFKGRAILRNASFKVRFGEIYALIGPNGAGKTTVLKVIAGLLSHDEGLIRYSCIDMSKYPSWERRFTYFKSPYPFIESKSIRENIIISASLSGAPRSIHDDIIREVSKRFDIGNLLDRKPRELSMGERQRAGLACIIASRPKALLLDEPLSHLSRKIALEVASEIKSIVRELDIPAIAAFPRYDDALLFGHDLRAGVIVKGQIIGESSLENLILKPPSKSIIEALDISSTNLIPLNDSRVPEAIRRMCNSKAKWAWIPPNKVEVSVNGEGLNAVINSLTLNSVIISVSGLKLEVLNSQYSLNPTLGSNIRVKPLEVLCYDEEGSII